MTHLLSSRSHFPSSPPSLNARDLTSICRYAESAVTESMLDGRCRRLGRLTNSPRGKIALTRHLRTASILKHMRNMKRAPRSFS